MTDTTWRSLTLILAGLMLGLLVLLFLAVPRTEDGIDWTAPMIQGGWMAWTFPIAAFFWTIASLILTFTLLAIRYPETPRRGILRIETTRGDRLFISLLGSAFLCLGWLLVFGTPLWGGLILSLAYVLAVFRWV